MISLRHRRVAWLIALFAVLGVGLIAHLSRQRIFELERGVRHTLDVRDAVATTLTMLVDAETGQRGFVISGDDSFLEPYDEARAGIEHRIQSLRRLTRVEAQQEASVRRIEALAEQKLALMAEIIALRRSGRTEAATAVVQGGRGKRLMDAIRSEATTMLEREQTALDERYRETAIAQQRSSIALLSGLGLAVVLVLGGLATVRRDMKEQRVAALKLSESERTFRLLAENASDLIRILGEDGGHLYVSPSSKRLLGYRAEELQGMTPESLLPDEDRARFMFGDGDKTARGTQSIVHRMRLKNGEFRWFETRIAPALYRPDGKPRLHLASRDITDRKEADDELRRQKALLQSIVTNMGDGLVVLDANRKVVMTNPAIARAFPWKVGEVASPTTWSADAGVFTADGATVFPPDEGPLSRALQGHSSDGVEIVMRDGASGDRTFSVTARPIRDGDAVTSAVAVFHDVTAQRRAEHDLLESEQRWRFFSESSFEGMSVSRAGYILDTNATFANWLGYEASDLVGMDGIAVFAPDDRDRVREATAEGRAVAYEARLVRKDGTTFPVEVRGRSVLFRGQPVRIAVIRDITERKAQEAQLAKHAETLRELSLRDELTGLYNRRGFLELSRQQVLLATRNKRALTVFYADLNGMKSINDQLGHEMGDRALVATAEVLVKTFRASDVVARLGGDEFAVLATDCDAEGIQAASARARKLIDESNTALNAPFQLSVSLGASIFDPEAPTDLETLMQRADEQMYQLKRARKELSRNRANASAVTGVSLPPASAGSERRRVER
jgi:diguanylate cyclase (GGDEF)-like protein/PAS domain S-box-containing protein